MATLVLSTVGTALGGPVGGAIGSLLGQSIDQQLFSPSSKGPRLGDRAVQTSSYGTQIPRVYGTMRVAGSVIWATDLVESSEAAGAKGQPGTTYSYSASFAVALSSRPLREIRRIWADGKLLRGEAGDFKVGTGFRFYDGGEGQVVDPLIASIEGIGATPAYRGLALAVFENLELAEYGNRIPFLTFEVVADEGDPTLAGLFADVSAGTIAASDARTLTGYAAAGTSMRAAIEPLVQAFDAELADVGGRLASASSTPVVIEEDELGSSAGGAPVARLQRDQDRAGSLPSTVLVTYYDPDRDYQSGQARADAGYRDGGELEIGLPAVLPAQKARSLAEEVMARSWARRDRLRIALPPARMDLRPGSLLSLPRLPGLWRTEQVTIDGMAVVVELSPERRLASAIPADAGRSSPAADLIYGVASLRLIELPKLDGSLGSAPAIYLAASNETKGWKTLAVEVSGPSWSSSMTTAARKSVLGSVTESPGGGTSELIDTANALTVQLLDGDQWLTSCDDDALIAGANLALVGSELVQFGAAEPLGRGAFRLSRLLRGRGGTEWGMSSHAVGEPFVLIDPATLREVPAPDWSIGNEMVARQSAQQGGVSASLVITGDRVKPWSPVDLQAAPMADGGVQVSWTRRSRVRCPWLDEVDVPLGEAVEQYAVSATLGEQSLDYRCSVPAMTLTAFDLEQLGVGLATITVRQIGDWGASRPATTQINLP